MAWRLFTDAALTKLADGTLSLIHYTDLSDGSQDFVRYFAETQLDPADNGAFKFVLQNGADIEVTVDDALPGSGHPATEVKLATSAAGLDGATGGAPLNLGPELISGASNAIEIHVRVTNTVTTIGNSTELSINVPPGDILSAS